MKMKIKVILVLFAAIGLFAFGIAKNNTIETNSGEQGIRFFEGTYEEALAKAKEDNGLVFIDVYATWCGPCKALSKRVFIEEEVGALFNGSFVNYKMDSDQERYKEYMQAYHIRSLPTLLFVNGDGEVVHRSIGLVDKAELIAFAGRAVKKHQKHK